jgi:ABC-type dipeptide/oligopeptide/nickel transport system permease subunit
MSASDGSIFVPEQGQMAPVSISMEPPRSLGREAWRRLTTQPVTLSCLIIVALYAMISLLTFTPYFDRKIDEPLSADKSYAPPALHHSWPDGSTTISPSCWLGLDFQGRSVFWRVLYGGRIALLITVCASAISLSIGAVLGLLAGYFGGWIDDVITWLFSTVSSVPWLLMVIALAWVIQNSQSLNESLTPSLVQRIFGGTTSIILALGLTDWVGLCRLMRGEVLKLRDRDFIIAGRAIGLGHWRILFRHIFPNTFHLVIITFSLGAVSYVQVEVVLAFLGLGITSKPSWGRMIDDSKLELLRGIWWEVTAATAAIFILCLALNILGDALRDALDPRLHGAR